MNLTILKNKKILSIIGIIALLFLGIFIYANKNEQRIGDGSVLGASITTINATDTLKDSRTVINDNFTALNSELIIASADIDRLQGSSTYWDSTYYTVNAGASNWNTAYSWGNHLGLYDVIGQATSTMSLHESTYNHSNYNTAYNNASTSPYTLFSLLGHNHNTLYDVLGQATSTLASHTSAYNHTLFLTNESDPVWLAASTSYYTKTQIDTQGEMETIWGVNLATDGEVTSAIATKDECSEISGCVVGAITDGNTGWDNSYGLITLSSLSSTATGLTYTSGTGVFSLTSGYEIPTSASSSNWSSFYYAPSNRITAGDYIDWSGNTLNVVGTLPVSIGGTGSTTLSGLLKGNGTGAVLTAVAGTDYLTTVASDATWTLHNSYPATCTNQFVRAIGDTNTCASVGVADLASVDFGAFTCNGSACTLDTAYYSSLANLQTAVSSDFHNLGGTDDDSPEAGDYAAASIDGDDINSNLAGRSLTLTAASPDTLDVDVELYTACYSLSVTGVVATTSAAQREFPLAFTATSIDCSTDTGTAVIQLDERVKTTPNTGGTDIMTSTLTCDNDNQNTTSFANAGIAAGALVNLDIDSIASSPYKLRVHICGTIDD